ncbi:hypothetical protein F5I97DRAFT_1881233 [Phlebopus sp. FC_14]|nr:hypothetical protein F5I97DRAFT_1881233 [Phlebopus sp. FC_14]
MSCPDCNRGSILAGTPTGSLTKLNGVEAYFAPAVPSAEGVTKPFALVLLSDAFGLPLVNTKIMADKFAKDLACDVWIPDLFNGEPILDVNGLDHLLPQRAHHWPLWDKIRLFIRLLPRIGVLRRNRPSVVSLRTAGFIKTLREEKKYSKIGAAGYCFGGTIAALLAPSGFLNSIVICHPGSLTEADIEAIDIPTAWACAEDDMSFSPEKREKAEAIFAARKGRQDFVPYEFVDYKGTAHGFACRPNFAFEDVKVGFEKCMEQTAAWILKTLE